MEELTLKEIKKYKFSAIWGIVIFTSLIIFQLAVILDSNDNCNNYSYTISLQEVDAFNENFITYKGQQYGSTLRTLISKIILNATNFKDEPNRVPIVKYNFSDESNTIIYDLTTPQTASNYEEELTKLKEKLKTKKLYTVSFEFDSQSGFINKIIIDQTYTTLVENIITE